MSAFVVAESRDSQVSKFNSMRYLLMNRVRPMSIAESYGAGPDPEVVGTFIASICNRRTEKHGQDR